MPRLLRSFIQDSSGATAAEYSLMVALIALVIIGAVIALGEGVRDLFENPELTGALD
jgi:pilus assembly protein Flp/PilA